MNQSLFKTTVFTCLLMLLAPVAFVGAVTPIDNLKAGLDQSAAQAGIDTHQNTDLTKRLGQTINFTFGILGTIFLGVILAGGVSWMTAGGNQEKVGRGKKFITGGVGGMLIIFMAYALVYVIIQALQLGANSA